MMSASPAVIPQWSSQSNQTSSPSIDELEAMYDEEEENEEYNTRKKKNKKVKRDTLWVLLCVFEYKEV